MNAHCKQQMQYAHKWNTSTNEAGSGTPMALGIIAIILIVGTAAIGGCAVYAHKARVQGIADLAALAGGKDAAIANISTTTADTLDDTTTTGESSAASCEIVAQVAQRNEVSVDECFVRNGDVYVHLRSTHDLGEIHAYARAGAVQALKP